MKKVVFAGPSIFGLAEKEFSDLEICPPAAAGDITEAICNGATVIGLIDGVFDGSPSVWHKEILAALAKNVPVYGAASMGALRAAECCTFGMKGVGGIFREFRDGVRTSDADVAVIHAPKEFKYLPLTVALVDVEATIFRQVRNKSLTKTMGEELLVAARSINFRNRTWSKIVEQTYQDVSIEEKTEWLQSIEVSRKQRDAKKLLGILNELLYNAKECWLRSNEKFSRTDYFAYLEHKASQVKSIETASL